MLRSLGLVLLLLTTHALSAQLAIEATFATDTVFVARSSAFFQMHSSTWNVGMDLTPAPVLTSSVSSPLGSAMATTTIGWSNTPRGLVATITESHTVAGFPVFASTGLHNARLRLSSRQPTPVRVRACVTGTTLGHCSEYVGSNYGGAIDFGGDGQLDVVAATGMTQSREWTVMLDATGIQIVTVSGGTAGIVDGGGNFTSGCKVWIEVVPVDAVVVDWFTATPISCSPPTTTLAGGSSLWPEADVVAGPCGIGRVTVASRMTSDPDRVMATLTETVDASSFNSSIPVHDSILLVRATVPTPLRVLISISATAGSSTADWSAALDIGDDGSFEVTSVRNRMVTHEALVVADARGLRLRLRAQGAASRASAANGLVEITVLPATACPLVLRGSACGVFLSGLVTLARRLELDVTTPAPGTLAKLLVGTQQTDRPLPFSPCRLYTDPLVLIPFVTDARGNARLGYDIPSAVSGMLVVQILALARGQPLELASSRALDASCR